MQHTTLATAAFGPAYFLGSILHKLTLLYSAWISWTRWVLMNLQSIDLKRFSQSVVHSLVPYNTAFHLHQIVLDWSISLASYSKRHIRLWHVSIFTNWPVGGAWPETEFKVCSRQPRLDICSEVVQNFAVIWFSNYNQCVYCAVQKI